MHQCRPSPTKRTNCVSVAFLEVDRHLTVPVVSPVILEWYTYILYSAVLYCYQAYRASCMIRMIRIHACMYLCYLTFTPSRLRSTRPRHSCQTTFLLPLWGSSSTRSFFHSSPPSRCSLARSVAARDRRPLCIFLGWPFMPFGPCAPSRIAWASW